MVESRRPLWVRFCSVHDVYTYVLATQHLSYQSLWFSLEVEFLSGLRKLCDKHEILLIVDEIMTGFGRTGKMFGFEHANIAPDIVCAYLSCLNTV